MKKHCSFAILFPALLLVLLLPAGCAEKPTAIQSSTPYTQTAALQSERKDSNSSNTKGYNKEAVTTADFLKQYNDVNNLKTDASIVVEGSVVDSEVFLHNVNDDAVPYTLCRFKVSKVYKGNVKENDIILYAEYGGVITAGQAKLDKKFPEMTASEKNQKIKFSFGTDLSKAGEKFVLFASNQPGFQILKLDQPYYMLVGDYHGKLSLDNSNGNLKQSLPETEAKSVAPLKLTKEQLQKSF